MVSPNIQRSVQVALMVGGCRLGVVFDRLAGLLHGHFLWVLLVLCSSAGGQISYDGYQSLDLRVYFEHAGERDGEFKLLFQVYDEGGVMLREWIHPGSRFIGFQVSLVERNGVPTAFFRHPHSPFYSDVDVPLSAERGLRTARGTFSGSDPRDVAMVAYTGDELQLGGTIATVLSLSESAASVMLQDSKAPTTIPLSSVGALRAQHLQLQKEFHRYKSRRWQTDAFHQLFFLIQGAFIFLFAAFTLVYGFILVGWLTRDKHLERRDRNARTR